MQYGTLAHAPAHARAHKLEPEPGMSSPSSSESFSLSYYTAVPQIYYTNLKLTKKAGETSIDITDAVKRAFKKEFNTRWVDGGLISDGTHLNT